MCGVVLEEDNATLLLPKMQITDKLTTPTLQDAGPWATDYLNKGNIMQDLTTFISNHLFLALAAAAVFVLAMLVELLRARRNVFNITPVRTTQLINRENAVVIDIRPVETYRQGHIIAAYSMPDQDSKQTLKKLEKFKNRPIIVAANAANESQKIAALLLKHGYNAYSLAGGMRAWSEAQMPLIKE
jgi:rhodanese-related sulfurtransferase